MKLVGLISTLALAGVRASSLQESYQSYLKEYREYQHLYSFEAYSRNLQEIEEHNAWAGKFYTRGVNQFTGLSASQMREVLLNGSQSNDYYYCPSSGDIFYSNVTVNETSWDYRT